MKKELIEVLLGILEHALFFVSPELKNFIHDMLKDLYAKALKTTNPFDNILVLLLAALLGLKKDDLEVNTK